MRPQNFYQKAPPRSQFSEHFRGTASLSMKSDAMPEQQVEDQEAGTQDDSQQNQGSQDPLEQEQQPEQHAQASNAAAA